MSGDILFLPHRLPYPPDRGDRTRAWQVLQRLTQLAPVHVICPNDEEPKPEHIAEVERIAASLIVKPRSRSKLGAAVRALLSGAPASVELFKDSRLQSAVAQRLREGNIDTIYAHSGQMAAFVPHGFAGRFVMDFVDMDSAKFIAMGGANAIEGRRLRAFEIAAARRADVTLFVSEAEAALFRTETGLEAHVLEIGVNLEAFHPDRVFDRPENATQIVFTGQMDYAPNVEAVVDFVRDVFPLIKAKVPSVTLGIVGRNPTAAVRALASEAIVVTGEVPDTRPWIAAADIVVAPLKLARGVQTKVLEAMAMGKAIVVSPQAAEGIDAVDGRDLIVSTNPADVIIAMLRNPEWRQSLGKAARIQAETRYSAQAVTEPLSRYLMS